MTNIFLSYSGKDKDTVETIINHLNLPPKLHKLWHYRQIDKTIISMELIIEKIPEADIFILLITQNALDSPYVQQELAEAIEQIKKGNIKEICSISVDTGINPISDSRIPPFIRNNIYYATLPINAAKIIKAVIQKY